MEGTVVFSTPQNAPLAKANKTASKIIPVPGGGSGAFSALRSGKSSNYFNVQPLSVIVKISVSSPKMAAHFNQNQKGGVGIKIASGLQEERKGRREMTAS